MHRIDTPNASDEGLFVGSGQVAGATPTDLDNTWFNDIQENVCNAIENEGVPLVKGDYQQLSQVIQGISGKKRNLNYNPAFYLTIGGGSQGITTPISGTEKLEPTGWLVGGSINTTGDLVVFSSPNGLNISGTASSTGQTINIYQSHSRLGDAINGNDTITTAGETKYFTSSVKYKKVSGSDFTIKSYIGSIESEETPINDVTNDSSVESVGMAYKQTSVNTKDLSSTPIQGCGFEISLASAGAFSIQIKNCDFTEGLTLPDFQTYGDYIADKSFAIAEYGEDSLNGLFYGNAPVVGSLSTAGSMRISIPIPTKDVSTADTLTLGQQVIQVYNAITGEQVTISNVVLTPSVFGGGGLGGCGAAHITFDFDSVPTSAYVGWVSFTWAYTKA